MSTATKRFGNIELLHGVRNVELLDRSGAHEQRIVIQRADLPAVVAALSEVAAEQAAERGQPPIVVDGWYCTCWTPTHHAIVLDTYPPKCGLCDQLLKAAPKPIVTDLTEEARK